MIDRLKASRPQIMYWTVPKRLNLILYLLATAGIEMKQIAKTIPPGTKYHFYLIQRIPNMTVVTHYDQENQEACCLLRKIWHGPKSVKAECHVKQCFSTPMRYTHTRFNDCTPINHLLSEAVWNSYTLKIKHPLMFIFSIMSIPHALAKDYLMNSKPRQPQLAEFYTHNKEAKIFT